MELVNKENEFVKKYKRTSQMSVLTFRNSKTMYLSWGSISALGLAAYTYIHFVKDGDQWFFFTNNEPTGYMLYPSHGERHNAGFNINSVASITMMLNSTPLKLGESYKVAKTDKKYDGHQLIQISFSSPVINNYKKEP